MSNVPEYIGSSGTFAAALLETAGYYYQDLALDALSATFAGSVGYLIYMIGVVIAVVNICLNGSYKFSGWLLIGPGLFFLVITNRVETRGSEWLFAGEQQPEIAIDQSLADVLSYRGESSETLPPARVSMVFAWYNNIVSGAVDEFVRLLNIHRTNTNWAFIVRQEVYSSLQRAQLESPQFRDLLHTGLLGQCRDYVEKAKRLTDPGDAHQLNQVREQYLAQGRQPVQLNSQYARQWLAGFRAAYESNYGVYSAIIGRQYAGVDAFISALGSQTNPVTIATDFSSSYPADTAVVARDIEQGLSCQQLWQFIRVGLLLNAKEALQGAISDGDEERYKTIMDSLGQITGAYDSRNYSPDTVSPDNAVRIYQTIGIYLLRNEMAQSSMAAFTNDYAPRAALSNIKLFEGNNLITSYRLHSAHYQPMYRSQMMNNAAQLPYYQGMVMCILGVFFPFFACLLLVPGYHSGFLYWCGLWLWVKCWDLGFALVMVLDEILYAMFSVAYGTGASAAEPQVSDDFGATIVSLSQSDPSFSLTTYYAIIGTALMSIPVTSSLLILGSVKAGAGLVAKGIDGYSQELGKAPGYIKSMSAVQGQSIGGQRFQQETSRSYTENVLHGRPMYNESGVNSSERDKERLSDAVNVHGHIPKYEGTTMGYASPEEMTEALSQGVTAQRMVQTMAGGEGIRPNDPLMRVARGVDTALKAWTSEMANLRKGRLELAALTGMYNASHGNVMQGAVATAGNQGMTQVSWGADPEAEDRWRKYENEADMALLKLMAAGGPVLANLSNFDSQRGFSPKPLTVVQAVKRIATYALAYDLSQEGSISREVVANLGQQLGQSVGIEEVQESLRGIATAAEEQYGAAYEEAVESLETQFADLGEGNEEFIRAMAAINMIGTVADEYNLLGSAE